MFICVSTPVIKTFLIVKWLTHIYSPNCQNGGKGSIIFTDITENWNYSVLCKVFQSLGLIIRDVTMRSLAIPGNTLIVTGKYPDLTTLLNFARVTRMEEYGFIFKTLFSTSVHRNNMTFLSCTLQLTIINRNT